MRVDIDAEIDIVRRTIAMMQDALTLRDLCRRRAVAFPDALRRILGETVSPPAPEVYVDGAGI